MAGNDFVMVELTPYGEALAGGTALRASNGKRVFNFLPGTPVRVEVSYEWNVLLSKMTSGNGQPLFQQVPAPAQTPAQVQAAAVRASYDQLVNDTASPIASTRTTAAATLGRVMTAAKLTVDPAASTKAQLADLGAFLTGDTDQPTLTTLAAAFATPPAPAPVAVVKAPAPATPPATGTPTPQTPAAPAAPATQAGTPAKATT